MIKKIYILLIFIALILFCGYNRINTKIKTYSSDIYITSDLEGRFDLYLNFFTRIGLLDFNRSPEDIKDIANNLHRKIVLEKDISFCRLLTEKITHSVISKAINKNFSGQIIINGDLTSNRIGYIFSSDGPTAEMQDIDLVASFNKCSVELLKTLKDVLQERLIIIAGNHDVHDSLSVHDVYTHQEQTKSLDEIKKYALDNLSLYRFYKILIKNKLFVFKHAAGTIAQHFKEILNKNNPVFLQPSFVKRDKTAEERYFWLYFNDSKFGINETTEKILSTTNVFLVHGHTHERPDKVYDDGMIYLHKQLSQNRLCSDWDVHTALLEGKRIYYYHLDMSSGEITAKDFFSDEKYFSANPFSKQARFI